jgi:hypothetical protein
MIKIDVEGWCSLPHPEDLIEIVTVRALPILPASLPLFKGADMKFFSRASGVIGKRVNRGLGRFQTRTRL